MSVLGGSVLGTFPYHQNTTLHSETLGRILRSIRHPFPFRTWSKVHFVDGERSRIAVSETPQQVGLYIQSEDAVGSAGNPST